MAAIASEEMEEVGSETYLVDTLGHDSTAGRSSHAEEVWNVVNM